MPRTVYLVVFSSPVFPAHWALWVAHLDDSSIGKLLNVDGDPANGFEIVFERNYDLAADSRRHQLLPLAQVSDDDVVDVKGDGGQTRDQFAHDRLEQIALSVPAPGRSLVSVGTQAPKRRVSIRNCQTWLREVGVALVQNGVMDQAALQAIDRAPKN